MQAEGTTLDTATEVPVGQLFSLLHPALVFVAVGTYRSVAYVQGNDQLVSPTAGLAANKKPKEPTMAPALPVAAQNPCPVAFQLVGKSSAGTMKVVELGPQLAKKKVKAYMAIQPFLIIGWFSDRPWSPWLLGLRRCL